MTTTTAKRHEVRTDDQVVQVRRAVREVAAELGLSLVDQTKMVTAASEIARNTVVYGGGGTVEIEVIHNELGRRGLRLVFRDNGPGIEDTALALRDGYTTGNGLGLGLGGARRLVNDFEIKSSPGRGTQVTLIRWK